MHNKTFFKYTSEKTDKFLVKYAKTIDDIDMFISPLSTLSVWHDSEIIKKIGIGLTILDLAILKTPFVGMYVLKTGDYKSAIEWLGWEALAHVIPYEGGLLNIRRNYEKNTKEYFTKKYEKTSKK